jgi:hypothetical protein
MNFILLMADPQMIHSVLQFLIPFLGSDALEHFTGTLAHLVEAYVLVQAIRKGQVDANHP